MLQTLTFTLVIVLLASGYSSLATEYPHGCKHDDFTVSCEGTALPKLEEKITSLQLKNATPTVPELSHSITRILDHLVSFQLSSAGLTTLQPGALGLMSNLQDLHLEYNNITVIHNDTFINCFKLLNLFLENNNIKVIQEGAFATLYSLQNMSLAHNNLHTLPSTLPQRLMQLSVNHNLLQEIPHLSLQNLTFLNLCHNLINTTDHGQIDARSMREICLGGTFKLTDKFITQEHFPVLESLHLRGTSESHMEIDVGTIRNINIMSATSLNELELHFCRITSFNLFSCRNCSLHTLKATNLDVIAVRISRPQFKLPSIVVADFSGSATLASSFLNSPISIMAGVKILRMSRCSITTFSKSMQEQKVPNITNLDISHNPLTCNCELSWIPDHVRDGRLTLENEIDTVCARPKHLLKKPLLTATLCPNVRTYPTVTAPELTVSTPSSEGGSRTNAPHPDPSNDKAKGLSQKHLILAILGIITACILVIYLLMILCRKIRSHCKSRNFTVYRVIYS